MKPEGSLPHSQLPATWRYPEPDQSSPYPPPHFLKIPYKLGSSKWSPSLRFTNLNPVAPLLSPIGATSPAHHFLLDLITRIIFVEEYRSLSSSLRSFFSYPLNTSPLGPNILLSTLFSNTFSLRSSFNMSDQVSHSYKTTGKLTKKSKAKYNRNFAVFQLSSLRFSYSYIWRHIMGKRTPSAKTDATVFITKGSVHTRKIYCRIQGAHDGWCSCSCHPQIS